MKKIFNKDNLLSIVVFFYGIMTFVLALLPYFYTAFVSKDITEIQVISLYQSLAFLDDLDISLLFVSVKLLEISLFISGFLSLFSLFDIIFKIFNEKINFILLLIVSILRFLLILSSLILILVLKSNNISANFMFYVDLILNLILIIFILILKFFKPKQ